MPQKVFIHESSYVEEPSRIGSGSVIMHFCHIMPHTIIGNNCKIGRNVTIEPGVLIGNNVVIDNNVTIKSGVIIEDSVYCGQSIVFTFAPTIRIREIKPEPSKVYPTIVKTGVNIGANSTIICGNNLGKYALIGAGSVITQNIPGYAFVYGNPAKTAGWACKCGKKLNFINSEAYCKHCKSIYHMISQEVVKVA